MFEIEEFDAATRALNEAVARYAVALQAASQGELGETEALRLQMAMDRMNQLMETLSNVLSKISDTDSTITQNLK